MMLVGDKYVHNEQLANRTENQCREGENVELTSRREEESGP